jgi:excisionase family DNA binding protein
MNGEPGSRVEHVRATVPRLALSVEEAAAALSLSRDTFERFVLPEIRKARAGRRIVISVRELERWVENHSSRALEGRI